jgi:hypothetical protein
VCERDRGREREDLRVRALRWLRRPERGQVVGGPALISRRGRAGTGVEFLSVSGGGWGFLRERERRGGCAVGFVWQISSKILAAISKEFHFGIFFLFFL